MERAYEVFFSNFGGCVLGASEIAYLIIVGAESEEEAMQIGLEHARVMNRESGLPPRGMRVSESELRRLATVSLCRRRPGD